MALVRLLLTRLVRRPTRRVYLASLLLLGVGGFYYCADGPIRRRANSPKLVLLWDLHEDASFLERLNGLMAGGGCPVSGCRFTASRDEFRTASAVVFTPIVHRSELPRRAFAGQIYVMYNMEPPTSFVGYPFDRYRGQYNVTMTYLDHPDTDVRIPLGYVVRRMSNDTVRRVNLRSKDRLVAWVVSNCNATSQRWLYAKELSKYVRVHVYGRCGTSTCGKRCFSNIERRYKFYLAFEKAYCRQYVTEKVFRTLNYNIVPIVLGGADYAAVLPRHSYIDVRDYGSPRQLAAHLRALDRNNRDYLEYFAWKRHHKAVDGKNKTVAFCRLCQLLHDDGYPYKKDFDLARFWNATDMCLLGDEEKDALRL